jgi:hypothetical protein
MTTKGKARPEQINPTAQIQEGLRGKVTARGRVGLALPRLKRRDEMRLKFFNKTSEKQNHLREIVEHERIIWKDLKLVIIRFAYKYSCVPPPPPSWLSIFIPSIPSSCY